jgi:argininosuccinate synthase
VLYTALQGLESICLDRETMHYKSFVAQKLAELIYNGLWFTPLREALQAFVVKATACVTGAVRVKLYKGGATVVGRKSPFSLYREDLATFGADDVYDQGDAEGFIKLFGLPLTVQALVGREAEDSAGPVASSAAPVATGSASSHGDG